MLDIFYIFLPCPAAIGVLAELGIIVAAVASHFFTDEMRLFEGLFRAGEFDLSHHKASIIAMEFIDFKDMFVGLYQPTRLVDNAWLTKVHQLLSISQRYLLFKLIA